MLIDRADEIHGGDADLLAAIIGQVDLSNQHSTRLEEGHGRGTATVQQRHQISSIVRSQRTSLLIIDLVSSGATRPAPHGEPVERTRLEVGPEFRDNAHLLASFANNIDAELYIAISTA